MSDVSPSPPRLNRGAGPGVCSPPAGRRWVAASTGDREGDGATMSQICAVMSSVKPWETFPVPAGWQRGDGTRQRRAVLVCPLAYEECLDVLCFLVNVWAAHTGWFEEAPFALATSQVSESIWCFLLLSGWGLGT